MIVQTDPRTPRVVLVGPPGAGKSTIGRRLARELGVELYDTDTGIEQDTGRGIPEIFAEDGEPEFRRIEERVVRRALLGERGVVSLGGGAVLSDATRALLRSRTVVYLEISVAEGLRRTGASTQRPLLNGDDPGAKYRELMRIRRPLYREVATVRVRTDGRSPGRVVRMILTRLGMESVLNPAEPDAPEATADAPTAGRSNRRGRSRRRGRATPTTDRAEDGTEPTAGSGTTEGRTEATGRSRRSRGRRSAGTARATGTSSSTDASQGRPTAAATPSSPRTRGRRARRPAGAPDASDVTISAQERTPHRSVESALAPPRDDSRPGESGEQSPTGSTGRTASSGRARRARARRARIRAAAQQRSTTPSPTGESEHRP